MMIPTDYEPYELYEQIIDDLYLESLEDEDGEE